MTGHHAPVPRHRPLRGQSPHLLAVSLVTLGAACATAPAASRAPGTAPAPGATAGRILSRSTTIDGLQYPYQVYVPAAAGAQRAPVILSLHGAGERGADGQLQTMVGLGPVVRGRVADFPAIVVMPQAPRDSLWNGAPARAALAALDASMAEFNGDPARVYLTGISMGGYGTFQLAFDQPDRFAAIVPVCPGILPPRPGANIRVLGVPEDSTAYEVVAARLAKTPVWIFHGGADMALPAEGSRRIFAALKSAGGNPRYTEYPLVGHNSWEAAYNEPALWEWLFAQRRGR